MPMPQQSLAFYTRGLGFLGEANRLLSMFVELFQLCLRGVDSTYLILSNLVAAQSVLKNLTHQVASHWIHFPGHIPQRI